MKVKPKKKQNPAEQTEDGKGGPKRGKKGKLKKMKDKYKDQDEEDKELRMQLLQGSQREKKKDIKRAKKEAEEAQKRERMANNKAKAERIRKNQQNAATGQKGLANDSELNNAGEILDLEPEEPANVNVEIDLLDSLTGIPVQEDELLFAVPVVAPYNTMTSYKYRVTITPGTSKRG